MRSTGEIGQWWMPKELKGLNAENGKNNHEVLGSNSLKSHLEQPRPQYLQCRCSNFHKCKNETASPILLVLRMICNSLLRKQKPQIQEHAVLTKSRPGQTIN
jgi:hypothetical protein